VEVIEESRVDDRAAWTLTFTAQSISNFLIAFCWHLRCLFFAIDQSQYVEVEA
jgi:hypothetical protein